MKLSRRALLEAGAAAALFPYLLRPSRAAAAAAARPKRKLLLFYTPHGTIWPNWRPSGTETEFALSPILSPLAAQKSRLAIVDGISLPYGTAYYIPHTYTMPALWTGSPIDTADGTFCRADHMRCFGWGTGISVDQAIAARLPADESPYRTIELGTFCGGLHPATRMIYSAPRTVKSPLDTPQVAFNTLFSRPDPNMAAAAAKLARRKSVLDVVHADLFSRKSALTPADRARLDAHGTAIRELERRLETSTPMCRQPAAPEGVDSETAMDRQSDLAAAALGCGLTRILSLQMRIADNDNSLYPWCGLETGGHHTLSHDSSAASQAILTRVYTWYAGRFAYLLDRLQATPDLDGGTVLDHTLVIWASELGIGWTHDISNVPFVFAGGSEVLRGGRYVKVTQTTNHRALVTACHAMGLSDVESYGSLDQGAGPIPGLLA